MNITDFPAKSNPPETIRQHTDKLLEQAKLLMRLGYINSDELYSDLQVSCEYHDYGKATSSFKARIERHKRFDSDNEIPHNVLSMYFIDKDKCVNYNAVCFAVAYHHYHSSPIDVMNNQSELIGRFLSEMLGNSDKLRLSRRLVKNLNSTFKKDLLEAEKLYASLLKGFLHKCDYAASAGSDPCEIPNTFLMACLEKWKSDNAVTINPLQQFCADNTGKDIIVTAPTGMGKTEAGLMWCGNNKCFFVLPLKTAINAMYGRFVDMFGEDYQNKVALIHSDMRSEYARYGSEDTGVNFDYIVRSRHMSLPVTVCTPDQIFDFVLKYPGYEYKLATASYSRFIIDEIQMYSPDLLAAIIYAIKLIHNAGGKIAVLTATLPPFVREELTKLLDEEINQADFSEYGLLRHNAEVYEAVLESEFITEKIDLIADDKVRKFLVVCNSIDTANRIYKELSQYYSDDSEISVNLFHSRFTKADRKLKEEKILFADKSDGTEIWVSTSVVEASLDIDFDILFTELADLFSLFQRFGRVNRKGKKPYDKTNCYVFTELQGNAKKFHFYDKDIHELSKQAILTVGGIIDEKQKSALIEEYLSCEKVRSSEYYKIYCKAMQYFEDLREYLNDKNKGLRDIDTVDVVPIQVYEENKAEIDEYAEIINSRNSDKKSILNANDSLMQYTVSVSRYKLKDNISYISAGYKFLPVISNCTYSFEYGFDFVDEKKKPYKG